MFSGNATRIVPSAIFGYGAPRVPRAPGAQREADLSDTEAIRTNGVRLGLVVLLAAGCELGRGDGAGPCFSDLECPAGRSCHPVNHVCIAIGYPPDVKVSDAAAKEVTTTAGTCLPGTACDDGNPCTEADACRPDGLCRGTAKSCADSLDCTADSCVAGACQHVPLADTCVISGKCYKGAAPHPAAPCKACVPAVSATTWSADDSATCTDGMACTTGDYCDGGTCRFVAKDDAKCDDGHACTLDRCLAAGASDGCEHSPQNAACDDGVPCTADACLVGKGCANVVQLGACDDNDPKTTDTCDPAKGCVHVPLT